MNKTHDEIKVTDKRSWVVADPSADANAKAPTPTPTTTTEAVVGDSIETRTFQAETKQLLDLMIHSLYSHKDIFLRELISNASDAIERLRLEALTNTNIESFEPEIWIERDKNLHTLTIRDNGIGMSRDEVITNIGTIAKSGTKELVTRLKDAQNDTQKMQLIGQFGVGFYSAFMVADRVTLTTRRAGETGGTYWASTGDGTYTIRPIDVEHHGTTITLFLKPHDEENGLLDFTDQEIISRIVKFYSDFVQVPIKMRYETEEEIEGETDEKGNKKKRTVIEDKTLNSMTAIWLKSPSEVKDEEYTEFYKHITYDPNAPMERIWLNAEGRIEYHSLLFIPSFAPQSFNTPQAPCGLQLYVRNVKIMDNCEHLVPRYLRFVRGVVDSPDLPLNVSRELLQENRQLIQIRRGIIKKVLSFLADLQNDKPQRYEEFWNLFGNALKEGASSDEDNRDKIIPLLMFQSSADPKKRTTFKEYVERMKPEQQKIYYLVGESRAILEKSPHLEALKERGYEVLYMVDAVDEFMLQLVTEAEGKKLKSAASGVAEIGTEEEQERAKKEREQKEQQTKDLLKHIQTKLDEHVREVRLSSRLTSSPVCLVGNEGDFSPAFDRMMRQATGLGGSTKRIMELNPNHAIFQGMERTYGNDKNDPLLEDYAKLLYGQALLAEGTALPDTAAYARLVENLMVRAATNA